MAYLCIRIVDRTTSDGNVNEIGDFITSLPDDWILSGKDFGKLGRREFAWIRCSGIDQHDLKSLLSPDIKSNGASGKRRRFVLDKSLISAHNKQYSTYISKAFAKGTETLEKNVINIPWDILKAFIIDKRSNEVVNDESLRGHFIEEAG